jgi:hypothetical protein
VHLCTDPLHQLLLTPQHIQPTAGRTPAAAAAGGSASPSQAASAGAVGFTTPTRKPPANKSTASSSSKKQSKSSSSKGSKQQQQQQQQEGGSASGSSAAAQWQLQLLQDGLDWSKSRQRQLMQQLVHKQLLGCAFLSGGFALGYCIWMRIMGCSALGLL